MENEKLTTPEVGAIHDLADQLDDMPGSTVNVPEAETLVAIAWYVCEEAIRWNTGFCSSQHTRKDQHEPETVAPFTCQCCRYFHSLGNRAARIRRCL